MNDSSKIIDVNLAFDFATKLKNISFCNSKRVQNYEMIKYTYVCFFLTKRILL